MKILVFPNDSIISYYNKGEIKKRYFNPGNLFDEVHIISFNNEEIPANKVADLAGKGKLFIHTLGKPKLSRLPTILKKLKTLTYHIAPSLIRCYNPHFMGAMGIYCSKGKIPVVISIHTDYSRIRRFKILKLEYLPRFFRSLIELLFFEPYVYRNANHFISVYPFASSWVREDRDAENNPMEAKMKRVSLIVVVVFSLVATTAFARGPRGKRGFGGPGPDPVLAHAALKDAGLSAKQLEQIDTLHDAAQRKTIDLRHDLDLARLEMRKLMSTYKVNKTAVMNQLDKIDGIKLRLKKIHVGLRLDIRKIMTEQQWEKVRLMRAKMRHGRRGMGEYGRGFGKGPGRRGHHGGGMGQGW